MPFRVRAGQRFEIQWRAGESLQTRVALTRATEEEHQEVTGEAASDGASAAGRLWYMSTPDGAVRPRELTAQALRIIVPYDMTNRRQAGNREGANPAGLAVHGREWEITAEDFCPSMRFALGQPLDEVIEAGLTVLAELDEPEAEAPRPPAPEKAIRTGFGLDEDSE